VGPNMPSGVTAPVEGGCFGLDGIASAPCSYLSPRLAGCP
jgi:hypothetical protein